SCFVDPWRFRCQLSKRSQLLYGPRSTGFFATLRMTGSAESPRHLSGGCRRRFFFAFGLGFGATAVGGGVLDLAVDLAPDQERQCGVIEPQHQNHYSSKRAIALAI